MVRRGMFHLPSPRKKANQSPRATKGAYENRNNPTVVPAPLFAYDDWKTRPWDEDSRGAGQISEDSVPPAPPGDNFSVNSNFDSVPQLDDVPGIVPRRNHGNMNPSPASQASAAIPKGSVQKNPFLAKDSDSLDENCQPHHCAPKHLKQAISVTQEHAKRLSAMEAQMQQQQQPPTPSRKGKKMFGRSKHAGDSPREKGKKKGLLKNLFGGKKNSHNKETLSFSNAPTSPNDGASVAVESQASFVVEDVEPTKTLSSVQKMKERFESSKPTPAVANSASSRTSSADGGSKSKPLITTHKSEADPNAFASSLLELATIEPPKEPTTAPSEDEHQPDCDETTVSCLTNPTYFQSGSGAWPSMLDDNMSCKSPPKVTRKKPAVEKERPKSPEMGDFFTQKESLDSWEKSDGFSDPFFNAKTSDSFPPDEDDDETAMFGSASASAFQDSSSFAKAFEDETKTDDFQVLKKQESPKRPAQESPRRRRLQRRPSQNRKVMNKAPLAQAETKPTTTPVRPPRLPQASPPVSAANNPARPVSPTASVASSVCGSVGRSRRSLRSMSPSARRRMRRSSSPVCVKPVPPTTKVVVPEAKPLPHAAPPSESESVASQDMDSRSKLDRRKKWAQKRVASFSNRSVHSQVSAASSKTKAKETEPPLPKSIATRRVDCDIDQKIADTKTSSSASTNSRTTASLAKSKFSQRYKKKQSTHVERNEQEKKATKPSLSLNVKKTVAESTIYVVATSPTKKAPRKQAFGEESETKLLAADKEQAASEKSSLTNNNDSSYKPSANVGRFSSRAKQSLSRKAESGKGPQKPAPPSQEPSFIPPPPPVKDHHQKGKLSKQSHQLRLLSSSDASSVASTITSSTGRRTSEAKPIPAAVFHAKNASTESCKEEKETLHVTCPTSQSYEPRQMDDASLTNTIFSVGKKQVPSQRLSELRMLLHRPRVHNRGRTPKHSGPMKTVFPCYDESKVTDPMARAGLRLLSASVIPIQAATRRFLAGRNLMTQWWAALVIQSRYRAFLREREFRAKRCAAIEIQRVARSMIVWQRLCLEDFCATEIQRCVRGYLASMKCYQAVANITLLQNLWRRRRAEKEAILRLKSIVLLQGWLRGNNVRQEIALQQVAAIEIQRSVRGHFASVKYSIQIYSITLIQAEWRKRRAQQVAFVRMTSILAIQAWARGNLLRSHLTLQHASAREIQRHVRGHLATLKVYEAIYYVTLLQKLVRQKQAVALATERMGAVLVLQAAVRGYLARRNLQRRNIMAVMIQRRVRGYLAVLCVYEEIYKVMLVQNLVRRRRAIQLAEKRKRAIIFIQSQYRKFRARAWLERQHTAATQVQRFTRGYLATLKVYEDIYRITIVQSCWRRRKAIQLAARRTQHATHLESVVRGFLTRKKYQIQHEKATIIQTIWRSFFLRMLYHFKIMDIIILQSLWRRKLATAFVARKRHDLQVRSATAIQSQWRAFSATMDYYEYLAKLMTVQSVSRRWLAQRNVLSYKTKYSLRLQRVARGFLGRLTASTRMYLVVSIQSLARTFIQRRHYKQLLFHHRSNAAIAIQRSWRGFACAADYIVTRADVIVAQSISRRWLAMRKADGLRKTKAATLIQSYWRCYDATITYLLYLSSVMTAQSIIRRWAAKRYVESYKAKYAIRLQSAARGFLARAEFGTKMYVILSIQSLVRMQLQQKVYRKQLFVHKTNAAILIQKTWRGFACMADYIFTMADIIIAQSSIRRWLAVKETNKLRQERDSILAIQSFVRSLAARRYVEAYKAKYALRLQSAVRGFLARSEFETKMYIILTLQSLARAHLQQKLYRKQLFVHKTNAATLIQKTWRGYACVADYIFTMADIVIAQSSIRRWFAMKQAKRLGKERDSILTMQSFFRCWAAKKYVEAYKAKYALRLQSAVRGFLARSKFETKIYVILTIQSLARAHLQQKLYKKRLFEHKTNAAILIQKTWRGFACVADYIFTMADIVIAQSVARKWLAVKLATQMRKERDYRLRTLAATKIQSQWRCYDATISYLLTVSSITKTQSVVRLWLANKYVHAHKEKYALRLQSAARGFLARSNGRTRMYLVVSLQSIFRGFAQRQLYQAKLYRHKEQAAITIQKRWRGFVCTTDFMIAVADIVIVQTLARRWFALKEAERLRGERRSAAAETIQSYWRGYCEKSAFQIVLAKHRSARSIQSAWRMYDAWCSFQIQLHHIIRIQAGVRGFLEQCRFANTVWSSIFMQATIRGFLARGQAKRKRLGLLQYQISQDFSWKVSHAAVLIQSSLRRYLAYSSFTSFKSARKIQAMYRCHIAAKTYRDRRRRANEYSAACRIQSLRKMREARLTLYGLRRQSNAVKKIQATWRGFMVYTDYLFTLCDIMKIQSASRRFLARRRYLKLREEIHHASAKCIQSIWRGYFSRTDYLMTVMDVVTIQNLVRRWLAQKEYQLRLEQYHQKQLLGALRIQKQWRSNCARNLLKKHLLVRRMQCAVRIYIASSRLREHLAARTIQAAWRGFIGFTNHLFARRHDSATRIQCAWRSHTARRVLMSLITECVAATMIQSAWRGYSAFEKYILSLVDIIKIQALARGKAAQRQLKQLKREKEETSAVLLQAICRSYLCSTRFLHARTDVVTIQSIARRYIAVRYRDYLISERNHQCATAVQSAWRGYSSFKGYVLVLSDIITVQSVGRRLLAKRRLEKLIHMRNIQCAVMIQKSWRGFAGLKDYLCALSDVITVQSVARQFLAKRCLQALALERSHKNAITIQKAWRGFSVYAKFCVVLCDVITVQSCARRLIAKREVMSLRWERDNSCATSIQTAWRRHIAVRAVQRAMSRILILQSFARMICGQRQLRQLKFEKKTRAALLLQSEWRKYFCMTSYAFIRADVILAQCQVRKYIARKEVAIRLSLRKMECARTIQRQWRMHFCRTSYYYVLSDIITAQSQVRVFLSKRVFSERLKNHKISSAIKIQKVWRSFFCFSSYLLVLSDVIKAQAQVRVYLAKRDFARRLFHLRSQSAIAIQNVWKTYLYRTSYEMARHDIIRVQCQVRRRLASAEVLKRLHRRREVSAIAIQKIWRGYVASTFVNSYRAATKIQKVWRGYLVFATYTILYADIIKVQSLARRRLARHVCDAKRAQRLTDAAVSIQKMFRGNAARTDLNLLRFSALTIQRSWRGHRGRVNLFEAWKAHVDQINAAATKIQSKWRAYDRQQIHLYTMGSVIQIQSICRMSMAKTRYAYARKAAILIQTHQRRFSCRMEILNQIAKVLCKKVKQNRFGGCALTIQCAWRRSKLQERVFCRTQLILGLKNRSAESITTFMRMATSKLRVNRLRLARKQNTAATTLQLWYRVAKRVRAKRRVRAGRTIYKFLRFVKAEVDREIRAQEKRMKFRQKMKNRTKEFDEAMLENAWEKIELNVEEPKRRRKDRPKRSSSITSEFSLDDRSQRSRRSTRTSRHDATNRSNGDDFIVDGRETLDAYSRSISRRDNPSLPPMVRSGNEYYNYPPAHYEMPAPTYRLPPSRMKTFSRDQIDQDLSLEEAYLDVEISGAKERRMTEKLMKQQQRRSRSSSRTRSSGSSVKSFRSTRSGAVPTCRNPSSGGARASSTSRASSSSRATMKSNLHDDRRVSRAAHRSSSAVRSSSRDRGGHSRAFERDCSSVVSSQDRRRISHRSERDCSSVVSRERSRAYFGTSERRRSQSPAT